MLEKVAKARVAKEKEKEKARVMTLSVKMWIAVKSNKISKKMEKLTCASVLGRVSVEKSVSSMRTGMNATKMMNNPSPSPSRAPLA